MRTDGVRENKIAFANPDDPVVVAVEDSAPRAYEVLLTVAGRAAGDTLKVTLPAESTNTFVVGPQGSP